MSDAYTPPRFEGTMVQRLETREVSSFFLDTGIGSAGVIAREGQMPTFVVDLRDKPGPELTIGVTADGLAYIEVGRTDDKGVFTTRRLDLNALLDLVETVTNHSGVKRMPALFNPQHYCGLVDHLGRAQLAQSFGAPLSRAAPHLMVRDVKLDIFLYRAWLEVLGNIPWYPAQQIGDCTSFGSGHIVDLLQCVQIAIGKAREKHHEVCTEAIYGMGRKIAGMLGRGDGCSGAAVAAAVMEGTIERDAVGPYDGHRAKEWGDRGGVPPEVVKAAALHPVKATAMVTTCAEAVALANLKPMIVCSGWGFKLVRDADGVCEPEGTWQHCMGIVAKRTRNGKRQYCIIQSWGDDVPSGPLTDGQPSFSFWINEGPMGQMLKGGDSFCFDSVVGWPSADPPSSWSYAHFI